MFATPPLLRPLALATCLSALAIGCGESGAATPKDRTPAGTLRQAIERVDGSVPVRLRELSAREGRPTETLLGVEGRLDLDRGTGRIAADLTAILPVLPPVPLTWNRRTVKGLEGPGSSMTRAEARESAGLLAQLPDLVEALPAFVRIGRGARADGARHWRFVVSAAVARRRGIIGRAASPKLWPAEAWADPRGRLRRIVLVVPLPAPASGALPAGSETFRLDLG